MPQQIEVVFDGTSLQLEAPLNLAIGSKLRIHIESVLPNKQAKSFLQTAKSLQLQGEADWSEKIDLYGDNNSRDD